MQFFAEQKMQKLPFHLKLITNFRKKSLRNRTVRYWIDEISVETNLWKHLKSTEHLFFLKLRDFLSIYNSNYSENIQKKIFFWFFFSYRWLSEDCFNSEAFLRETLIFENRKYWFWKKVGGTFWEKFREEAELSFVMKYFFKNQCNLSKKNRKFFYLTE